MSATGFLAATQASFDLLRPETGERSLPDGGRSALVRPLLVALMGSVVFGLSLGTYSQHGLQMLSSAVKLPLLLVGTAVLCFPSFHVLQTWRAPRPMGLLPAATLQAESLATVALIWASLAPPIVFLVGSIRHYRLGQFLAVVVGAMGGVIGLRRLLTGYSHHCLEGGKGPRGFLLLYFLVFGAVGSQLAWMLRPFLGSPTLPFELLRAWDPETRSLFDVFGRWIFG